jgi:hypothetical protein
MKSGVVEQEKGDLPLALKVIARSRSALRTSCVHKINLVHGAEV